MPPPRRPTLRAGAQVVPGSTGGDESTFGVENFKSIASAQLVPRRLTILAGANSTGKSSLLQALLFFAQSVGQPSVVINGDLVRLGEGADVLRSGASDLTLNLQFDAPRQGEGGEARETESHVLRLVLDSPPERAGLVVSALSLWVDDVCVVDLSRIQPPPNVSLSPGEQLLGASGAGHTDGAASLVVSGIMPTRFIYRLSSEGRENLVYGTLERPGLGRLNILNAIISSPVDPKEVPKLQELSQRFERNEILAKDDPDLAVIYERVAATIAPDDLLTVPIAAPMSVPGFPAFRLRVFGGPEYLPEDFLAIHSELSTAIDQAQFLAATTIYLGPLRDDPRVAYPLGHTISGLPVGVKGEFTAAYLLDNASVRTLYFAPDGSKRNTTLMAAITEWCSYLGIADEVRVDSMGKLGHQLRLKVAGALRDPTAIGVGASQLLPVVALVLGASPGAVVLTEQPELHLHPKVQSRLADFFARARPDLRLIVETHSENLLTRVRVRVTEGVIPPEAVNVLFASQQSTDDGSQYTEFYSLSLNELGNFDLWPEDFFDSLDDDAAALAKAVAERVRSTHSSKGDT